MPKNYYKILGVNRDTDLAGIKKAYKRVSKKYHPDTSQTETNSDRFLEIKEAYENLSDDDKRKRHDRELKKQGSELKGSRPVPRPSPCRGFFDEREDFLSSLVQDLFGVVPGGLFDMNTGRGQEEDLYFEAVLSPSEAAGGGRFPVRVSLPLPCPRCRNRGIYRGFECPVCSGSGRVESEREFAVDMPPHLKDGTEISFSMEELGLKGVNLNLVVHIDPDLEMQY